MPEQPLHVKVAASLADSLDAIDQLWATARHDHKEFSWYGPFLGTLVPLIGEQKVEYVTSAVRPDGESLRFQVVIFTESVHIYSTVLHTATAELPTIETHAVSRKSLTKLEAFRGADVFANSFDRQNWPGHYQVAAHYRDLPPIALPLGRPSSDASSQLVAFLPSLLTDLG